MSVLMLVGGHSILVTDVQGAILVRCDEPRRRETRAITTTNISQKLSTSIEHTHCITTTLSHIKYVITVHIHTKRIMQFAFSLSFTINDSRHLTLGGELLNSIVAQFSYIDHPFRINGYSVWTGKLSWSPSVGVDQ